MLCAKSYANVLAYNNNHLLFIHLIGFDRVALLLAVILWGLAPSFVIHVPGFKLQALFLQPKSCYEAYTDQTEAP